tara:strand:- start:209 stop:1114 length:906 start_codon:yes stop_codon:yes gene_type:complete
MNKYKVIGFYKFIPLSDVNKLKLEYINLMKPNKILGTLILANEGLNGMLAGEDYKIDLIIKELEKIGINKDDIKISYSEVKPFNRLRVKAKEEIISLGYPELSNPNNKVGTYLDSEDWNKLLDDDELILIDTRNYYETSIGTFENAIVPDTNTFKDFPSFVETLEKYKNKKVAMFCTGGIRCEKASSYLLELGFKDVFHLKGGILKYLEEIPKEESKWEGECFVFDNRVAVEHNLDRGTYIMCNACGEPVSHEESKSSNFKKGIHCPKCLNTLSDKQINKATERQKQIDLAKKKGKIHIGE